MNAPEKIDQKAIGLYHKFNVTRTDGDPTGKHANDEYFVLNLTTDKHAIPAIAAYAESCGDEYPQLSHELHRMVTECVLDKNEFITMPEVTLPGGRVVPSFMVGKYATAAGLAGIPVIGPDLAPWVEINFEDAKQEAMNHGYNLLTESQALAIAHDIVNQDINWTGGKVGEGKVYMGLHKGNVRSGQPGTYESDDPEERRWHQLSNGERIYDFSGNVFTWVFDDVQGDEKGLTGKIKTDSPSRATAPYPSGKKGMGWQPTGSCDWSGSALVRGGFWSSESNAGVFLLYGVWPVGRNDSVGFRCTK